MKRVLQAVGLLVIGGVVAGYFTGTGRHRVTREPVTVGAAGAAEFAYVAAVPAHTSEYVWPVVDAFLTDVPRGAQVLDMGAGNGALLASFEERGWTRVGLDISKTGIVLARQSHPEIEFIEADATSDLRPLIGENRFDVVVSTETLEHVHLPRHFLANAYAALKPGGRLVVSVPYNGYLKHLAIAIFGRSDQYFDPLWDWGHIKFYSVDTLSSLLAEAGFDTIEWEGAGRAPYLWKSLVMSGRKPVTTLKP